MANEKMNTVGTKKAMLIYLLADGKCMECRTAVQFKGFNVSHIIAQQTYIENEMAIDNRLTNLVCLCETCNKRMQNANGFQYWNENIVTYINKRNKRIAMASNPNDVRTILNIGIQSFEKKVIDKLIAERFCDNYAKENPSSKFAKIHKNGRFYKKAIAMQANA